MPRRAAKVPSYCHHKQSGRAVVRIDGHDHYLGPYGSAESHERYERQIAEWRASRIIRVPGSEFSATAGPDSTISNVLLEYAEFAENHYVKDGEPTAELDNMRAVLRPLRRLYRRTKAADFGPKCLKVLQQKMIADGLCRGVVNARVGRIKRFFKWAVAEELIPATVYHGLQAVRGLSFGRTRTTARHCRGPEPQTNATQKVVSRIYLPFSRTWHGKPDWPDRWRSTDKSIALSLAAVGRANSRNRS